MSFSRYALAALAPMLVAIAPPQYLRGDQPDPEVQAYAEVVRGTLNELDAGYSVMPSAPSYRQVEDCKAKVDALLQSADSSGKRDVLSRELVAGFDTSKAFRWYEYYVLWRGHSLFAPANAGQKPLLLSLAAKVSRRGDISKNAEVTDDFARAAIETLCEFVGWKHPILIGNGEIDWKEWERLSSWITANYAALSFNAKTSRFELGK